ncbi:MAG TPA: sulfite exporter TauE/SafE family protein [Bryobacteraceae bacterium]|nr:sulfite exporter TauE/SafE family protein [Bryobacteraceae bacterium]
MPPYPAIQLTLGAVCGVLVGIAKTGVPGLGILVVPLMVLAVGDARQSAAWLLPMLCTADVFAVLYWRRHAAARALFSLAPWVIAGMAAGAIALALHEGVLRFVVGSIVLLMLVAHFRRIRNGTTSPAHSAPYGVTAGFATTVANAAGPAMNLYLLSRRLAKEEFVATGAWFFFIINLTKVPIYAAYGLYSPRSLIFDAWMIPAVLLGAWIGRRAIDRIPQHLFEWLVIALTAVSTTLMFF